MNEYIKEFNSYASASLQRRNKIIQRFFTKLASDKRFRFYDTQSNIPLYVYDHK